MKKEKKQTESLEAVHTHTHTHTHGHSKERGITLIALVVTIVVLLILAGISLSLVLGNNGIITKAKESRTETRIAQIDELVNLAIGDAYTDGIGSITDSGLKSALNNRIGEGTYDISGDETTGWQVTVKETGKTYDIAANGKNDSSGESDSTVDWDAVLEDAKKNPEKYKDENQDASNGDIGIGTDGKGVNMDLWTYQPIAGKKEVILNKGEGSSTIPGYSNNNIVDGKIQGKIPEYIKPDGEDEFYRVTGMQYTFANCENLEEGPEEIPSGVTSYVNTFVNCTSLTRVTISANIKNLDGAFSGCQSLESIIIPDNVISIGENIGEDNWGGTFYGCEKITEIRIPEGVENIATGAFYGCNSLKNIDVDEKNKYYSSEDGILWDKEKKIIVTYPAGKMEKSYEIKNGVTTIGNKSFAGCTNLESLTIPESVTLINPYAFEDCTNLDSIIISNGVTEIQDGTFSYCTSLSSIIIPESVTSIGNSAFYGCESLKSIVIPSKVSIIDAWAFGDCNALADVYFEETTAPNLTSSSFYQSSGVKRTFHFKNQEVYDSFTEKYYNKDYGEKSSDFNW